MLYCLLSFACAGLPTAVAAAQPVSQAFPLAPGMPPITGDALVAAGSYHVPAGPEAAICIAGDTITVDFQGSELVGASEGQSPDRYAGTGIRVTGRRVTLRNVKVRGYKVAIDARACAGVVIEDVDVSGNYRQRLASTPLAEDTVDWLQPHDNDAAEWRTRYGAGVYLEACPGATVRRVRARSGQNGIVLNRVHDARVYDNDCSFLSGWGLALWRSSDNIITRNALDFCVRGYSHGVYNRGQDSAGILMFEQCCRNTIAENSATHCGDGLFGFAGKEALARGRRAGNNDNLVIANDFSHAAAHGIEMTFSFGNRLLGNRLSDNAICGIWGGYSQDTVISGNMLESNGAAGYGAERGGVNIEHGRGNTITHNTFRSNACGVRLWSDDDPQLAAVPWVQQHDAGSTANTIARNVFEGDEIAVELVNARDTRLFDNHLTNVGQALVKDEASAVQGQPEQDAGPAHWSPPSYEALGQAQPVGGSPVRGRDRIVVTEWGPYDFTGYEVHPTHVAAGRQAVFQVLGPSGEFQITDARGAVSVNPIGGKLPAILTVSSSLPGLQPFSIALRAGGEDFLIGGTLLNARWQVQFYGWDSASDPLANPDAWKQAAPINPLHQMEVEDLNFRWGTGAPAEGVPPDHFATVATAELPLPAGTYTIRTVSDDGIRVWVDGGLVIDDWTHHAPKVNEGNFYIKDELHSIRVEHFEIDGNAELRVEIIPR